MANYSINTSAIDGALSRLARDKQVSKEQIIQNALGTYMSLVGALDSDGEIKLSFTNHNDEVVQDVLLP